MVAFLLPIVFLGLVPDKTSEEEKQETKERKYSGVSQTLKNVKNSDPFDEIEEETVELIHHHKSSHTASEETSYL